MFINLTFSYGGGGGVVGKYAENQANNCQSKKIVFLNNLVTCYETWFYFFEPESKQLRPTWKHTPLQARLKKSRGKLCQKYVAIKKSY